MVNTTNFHVIFFSVGSISMLVCVKFGNGMRAVYNSATAFFKNIGGVKCNSSIANGTKGMAMVDETLVSCWEGSAACQPGMKTLNTSTELGRCLAYGWNIYRTHSAKYSMILVV